MTPTAPPPWAPPPAPPIAPPVPPKLDQAVMALSAVPRREWWRASWRAVAGTVATVVLGGLVVLAYWWVAGRTGVNVVASVVNLVGEAALLLVALAAARRVRDVAGGWGKALGWFSPTWGDVGWGLLWVVVQLVTRIGIGLLLSWVPRSTRDAAVNTRGLSQLGVVALVLLTVGAVLVAPIAEETLNRGVLLRAGMARWGFVRAALVSSVVFGAFHAYEAGTLAAAGILAFNMFAFGFLQCVLVRITGRLNPCAVTHAVMNGFALALAVSVG